MGDVHKGKPRRHRGRKTKYVTSQQLNGGRLFTKTNPPDISYQPWNHLTLVHMTKQTSVNFGDLVNVFKAQVDPTSKCLATTLGLQMKIHSIKVWNLTGHTVAMSVYDYIDSNNDDQLMGAMDTGTNTDLPSIGYQLPMTFRQHVMRNDKSTGSIKLYTTSAPEADTLATYIRLEWRFDGPVKAPEFDTPFMAMMRVLNGCNANSAAITMNTTKIQRSSTHQEFLLNKLIDAQPTLVERIIDGGTHLAANVLPVVAEDVKEQISNLVSAIEDIKLLSGYDAI